MARTRVPVSDSQILADLLRRVASLENKLDQAKQLVGDDFWQILELTFGNTIAPGLSEPDGDLHPSTQPRSFSVSVQRDINIVNTGDGVSPSGDINIVSRAGGDVNIATDDDSNDINIAAKRALNLVHVCPESATASGVGSIVAAWLIYDGGGSVVGYVPIYDTFS